MLSYNMSACTCSDGWSYAPCDGFMAWGEAEAEAEAAEVLASLGRSNSFDDDGSGGSWGSKGRRSSNNKRVRDNFEVVEFEGNGNCKGGGDNGNYSNVERQHSSLPLPFDLNMDQTALYEESENNNERSLNMKIDEEYEQGGQSSVGVCNSSRNGNRSRQDMTEAEKEARRVRRVLANRESARQTIRRRQALYEELKRRSAELTSENEDLKRTKKLAVQEFQSLQTTNHNLKDKITQITGLQLASDSQALLAHKDGHVNHPSKWHQLLPSKVNVTDSPFPSEMTMQNEQGNTVTSSSQQIPWCILPCPWFLSIPDTVENAHRFASLKVTGKDEEILLDTRHDSSPSSVIPRRLRGCQVSSDARVVVKADSSSLCSSIIGPVLRTGVFSGQLAKKEVPPTAGVCSTGVTTRCGEEYGYDTSRKKRRAAAAGAEARRRRREVIKYRSLHYVSTDSRGKYS